MEYLFFGLPVVGYDLTENRVSAGPGALFATPNREADLAQRILELLDDPARRQEMGRIGRERVRSVLAWEHSAPVLLAAYDRLWPDGGPRPVEAAREPAASEGTREPAIPPPRPI
jgi:glycosyltransferase involved in cell wall biosynthesis